MRKKIYEIIDNGSEGSRAGQVYDAFMLVTIVVSLIPLLFRETNYLFLVIEQVTVIIFIIDYVLRLLTADLRLGKGGKSFLEYPFTPMAIVDLLSILPSLVVLNKGLKAVRAISFLAQFKVFRSLRIFRLLRLLRVFKTFRVFKLFRYSKNLEMVGNVLKKQKDVLGAVVVLAVGYILVVALIMFNIEPATFGSYFDAVYWATVSLTTIGYGDIAAATSVGRFITMISALVGVAIIALPSGIITAGFMDELNNRKQEKDGDCCGGDGEAGGCCGGDGDSGGCCGGDGEE